MSGIGVLSNQVRMSTAETQKDIVVNQLGRKTRNSAKNSGEDITVNATQTLVTSTPKSGKATKKTNTPGKTKIPVSSPIIEAKKGVKNKIKETKSKGPVKCEDDKDIRKCFNVTSDTCATGDRQGTNRSNNLNSEPIEAESDTTLVNNGTADQTLNVASPELQSTLGVSFHSALSRDPILQANTRSEEKKEAEMIKEHQTNTETQSATPNGNPPPFEGIKDAISSPIKTPNQNFPSQTTVSTTGVNMELLKNQGEISNATVVEMFQTLLTSMSVMKEELRQEIQSGKIENKTQIDQVQVTQTKQSREIADLKKENTLYKVKLDQLADTLAYQGHLLSELSHKTGTLDFDKYKPNLIIQGITEKKNENCVTEVKSFFKNQLNLVHDIQIKYAYRIGKSKNRPLKVCLTHPSDKGLIYSHAKNLKDKTSSEGKDYRIDDELPPKQREQKNKARHMVWRNKKTTAEKIALSVKKGKLMVGDLPYTSKITPPSDHILCKLKPEEVNEIDKLDIRKGITETLDGSDFTGYIADVQTFEEVNRAFEYVRYYNLQARHIIVACKIPGSNVIESVDFYDSDEHGAGQKLLSYMDEAELENRAIFVVRHYSGKHIGAKRFELIIKAATSAVNSKPFNTITKTYQFSWRNKGRGGHSTPGRRLRTASEAGSTASVESYRNPTEEAEIQHDRDSIPESIRSWADRCPSPVTVGHWDAESQPEPVRAERV